MAFLEYRMFDCVRLGFQAGPAFDTRIVTMDNGREKRNQNWANPRRTYVAPLTNLAPEEYAAVLNIFIAARGRANGFRFKDWSDYRATLESLGNAPSGSTPVQLVKTYGSAFGSSYSRTIAKPVSNTVEVFQGGTPKTVTVNTSTGYVTPTTSWSAGQPLTWTGEFDVPVRFQNDALPMSWDNRDVRSLDAELIEILL